MALRRVELSQAIHKVSHAMLRARGVRGVILDLDNTLVAHGTERVAAAAVEWLADLRSSGIALAIVSNSRDAERVERVARSCDAYHVARAFKPWPAAFARARALLGTPRENTIVIGDKLFTDIIGAHFAGMDGILVRPIAGTEESWMRPFRFAERAYLRCCSSSERL